MYYGYLSDTKTKVEALRRIARTFQKPYMRERKGLIISGPFCKELNIWRSFGLRDKNTALVDSEPGYVANAVKWNNAPRTLQIEAKLSECVNPVSARMGKLDHMHLDLTSTLGTHKSFYSEIEPVLVNLTKRGTVVAITYLAGRDPEGFRLAKKHGDRNSALVHMIGEITGRNVTVLDSDYYSNGRTGRFPMAFVSVKLGQKKQKKS